MFRVFGFTGALALVVVAAAGAVVFGVAVSEFAAPGAGAAAPVVELEPALLTLPVAGVVVVAGASGSVVIGVGTGGSGFDNTPVIRSVSPASESL